MRAIANYGRTGYYFLPTGLFLYNSQSSNIVQNIMIKLFKYYKLLTKSSLAVRYAKTIHNSLKA